MPPRLMLLIVLTNWLWIPAIAWYDVAVRRAAGQRAAGAPRDLATAAPGG